MIAYGDHRSGLAQHIRHQPVMEPASLLSSGGEHLARIAAERRINEGRTAEERRQYEARLAATYEPPPF